MFCPSAKEGWHEQGSGWSRGDGGGEGVRSGGGDGVDIASIAADAG